MKHILKALFLDADGTLWYLGNEDSDGFKQPPEKLTIDPNFGKLLEGLSDRRIPLWIVSYNDPGTVEQAIEHFNLIDIITYDRISCNWDDKGYRIKEILLKNGFEKALFVGDRQSDYQASLAAGIDGKILKRRFNRKFWFVGPTISSLLEILPLLDAL